MPGLHATTIYHCHSNNKHCGYWVLAVYRTLSSAIPKSTDFLVMPIAKKRDPETRLFIGKNIMSEANGKHKLHNFFFIF